jgi:hypothetical protein
MSITTYSELQSAIGNWAGRDDLTTRLPEFIALFEAQLNRKLRVRQQITSTTLSPSSGTASLPSDYLEWKRVTWSGTPARQLQYATPEYASAVNPDGASADPIYFTIEGANLKVVPISDTSISFLYAQKVPALTDSNTTNWLLTAHPDAYLYGSLEKLATYTQDLSNGVSWHQLAAQALDEMWSLNFATTGASVQRAAGPTP